VVWGTVILADSARLSLTLYDAEGDSTAGRVTRAAALGEAGSRGAAVTAWQLGLGAAKQLLPRLIPAGGRDAAPALAALDPSPAAAASFLLGEIHYRAARYDSALVMLEEAVALDSGFAMAAIRGAQAASWLEEYDRAGALAELALARDSALPPRLQLFAHGLQDYLAGRADRAADAFRVAVTRQPDWAEAWTALGEVYEHLLPPVAQPDSMAREAFEQAHRLDRGLLPPTYHLAGALVREGRVAEADSLIRRYAGSADSVQAWTLQLMASCVRGHSGSAAWRQAAGRSAQAVFEAAVQLAAAGLRQPGCASGAWQALVASPTPADEDRQRERGFAQVGLLAVDVARGRPGEAAARYRADSVLPQRVRLMLPLLLVPLGVDLAAEADAARRELTAEFGAGGERSPSPVHAWILGTRAVADGDRAVAAAAAAELARRAAGGGRLEGQLALSLAARVALAAGDTAGAMARLAELRPGAPLTVLGWAPWETLGAERMLLARLRLTRGDTAGARLAASGFDAAAAPIDILYLRPSLELRAAAGDPGARRRLQALTAR
jgi:tetratricopeptide (TPR) repeat protein